jgi:prepilin peptidase CpaA
VLLFDCLFVVISLVAAGYDFIYYKIPNFLVGLLILALFTRILLFAPLSTWLLPATFLYPFLIFLGLILFGFILFRFGMLGAGDVKFLAIASAWAFTENSLMLFLLIMSGIGGVLGLVYLKGISWINGARIKTASFFNRMLSWPTLTELDAESSSFSGSKSKVMVPYGVAIGCAVLTLFIITMNRS